MGIAFQTARGTDDMVTMSAQSGRKTREATSPTSKENSGIFNRESASDFGAAEEGRARETAAGGEGEEVMLGVL